MHTFTHTHTHITHTHTLTHTPRSHTDTYKHSCTQSYTHSYTTIHTYTHSTYTHSQLHSHIHTYRKLGQALHKGKYRSQQVDETCPEPSVIREKWIKSTRTCQHTARRDTTGEIDKSNVLGTWSKLNRVCGVKS